MKFNFIVIPYRDQYFLKKYGFTVRDLAIIKSLADHDDVVKISVINRPVSLYERFLNKKKIPSNYFHNKIDFVDTTSFDLFGPLKRRKWTEYCYKNIPLLFDESFANKNNFINVVLDFTPLAKLDCFLLSENTLIWYDLIDNFVKHNRYDAVERDMVNEKYERINRTASLITGVTSESISRFNNENMIPVNNGILNMVNIPDECVKPAYAFGVIGFITDKIDTEFLNSLANESGEEIVIYGEVYDKNVAKKLEKNSNIHMMGAFHSDDTQHVISTFEVGLIPYQTKMSHDGSPLKLYQYISYGKPVVSIEKYAEELSKNKYVLTIEDCNIEMVIRFLREMRCEFINNKNGFSKNISNYIKQEYMWSSKIDLILNLLKDIYLKKTKIQ